jgi:hypothetical protein
VVCQCVEYPAGIPLVTGIYKMRCSSERLAKFCFGFGSFASF